MHKFSLNRINLSLLIPSLLLVFIGLSVFYSIDTAIFKQQLFMLFISIIGYLIFLNINFRIFTMYGKYIYVIILVLLSVLLLVGTEVRGAVRWMEVLGIRLQLAEVIKPFFIIVFAQFLSRSEDKSFTKFIQSLLLLLPILLLTIKQPDLGNGIIYFVVGVYMLFTYRFPLWYFLFLALMLIIPIPVFFEFMHGYQKERILSFLNTSSDPFGSSYNAIQSLISIGSGGIFGKGLGQATQSVLKFLPERHTDFIFASVSESLGIIGSLLILLLFGYFLYTVHKILEEVDDLFCYLFISGFYMLILIHVFFNVGMNIGILPIVGITLPFVSYGGSSLLTHFIVLGILSSVSYEFKRKESVEIR